jgi:hypothetical protein
MLFQHRLCVVLRFPTQAVRVIETNLKRTGAAMTTI